MLTFVHFCHLISLLVRGQARRMAKLTRFPSELQQHHSVIYENNHRVLGPIFKIFHQNIKAAICQFLGLIPIALWPGHSMVPTTATSLVSCSSRTHITISFSHMLSLTLCSTGIYIQKKVGNKQVENSPTGPVATCHFSLGDTFLGLFPLPGNCRPPACSSLLHTCPPFTSEVPVRGLSLQTSLSPLQSNALPRGSHSTKYTD